MKLELALSPPQWEVYNDPSRFRVLIAGRRFGKALALDTPIPTPDGWTTMGEVEVGDTVFDERGRPCSVTFATGVMENSPCYRLAFSDGTEIVADAEHQWLTWDRKQRKNYARNRRYAETRGRQGRPWHTGPQNASPKVRTTAEIAATLQHSARGDTNHSVECCEPLRLPDVNLPVDPYVLGAWLGDGASQSAKFYTDDPEILRYFTDAGVPVRKGPNDYEYLLQNGDQSQDARDNSLQAKLRAMGVLNKKHVPLRYLRASAAQRLALLQGLMDTDGSASKTGAVEFCSTNKGLASAVLDLSRSLGIRAVLREDRATLNGRDCGARYRVTWTSDVDVFRLGRKRERLRTRKGSERNTTHRFIVGGVPCESVPVRCIQVDSPSHLYLASEAYIPTHNTHLACVELLTKAANKQSADVWYVAPTYRMAKEIAWRLLKQMVPRTLLAKSPNETELSIHLVNGSTIALRGADNPDSLRGVGLDLVVPDEFAWIHKTAWEDVLRPALADRGGSALFITSPAGHNWAYDLYLRGKGPSAGWRSWQFTTLQGGRVDEAELAEARATLDPRKFRQEFEASFETLQGRVYDNFHRDLNVDPTITDVGGELLVGMDFNVNPMSAVLGVRAGDECHILDEMEVPTSNTEEVAREIRARYPDRHVVVCPDPSGKARKTSAPVGQTDFTILQRYGFEVRAPNKAPPVVDRVNNTQAMLLNGDGRRRARIHPRAGRLIRCLDGLTYKEGTSQVDKKLGIEHLPDAHDYLLWQEFNVLVSPPSVRTFQVGV